MSTGVEAAGCPRIAYCGPIAEPGLPARGGYESANRRLIDDLKRRGCKVIEFPYPVMHGAKLLKGLAYVSRLFSIGIGLVRHRRSYDIIHITSLYWILLYHEVALCLLAHLLGKRVLFDIRAGSFVHFYETKSGLYRYVVDAILRDVDLVAVEGKEYLPFIAARRERLTVHLPNYVSELRGSAHGKSAENVPIRLLFLGRVVPEKGIEIVLDTVKLLSEAGLGVELDVVGDGNTDYIEVLRSVTRNLPVHWLGPQSPSETLWHVERSHFFVFPTRHIGEGHSNALTEAMAQGVVPICSDQGFNRSVVDTAGCVLPVSAGPDEYASAISDVWNSGRWAELSNAAHQRVSMYFQSDVVVPVLLEYYGLLSAETDR